MNTMRSNRKSRWSLSTEVNTITDRDGTVLPSAIQANMTPEQVEIYVAQFRIREITNQLQLPDTALQEQLLAQAQRRRDPSPDPEYDTSGRRTNTRLQRRRRALEAERHRCVEEVTASIATYQPPLDYRRPTRFTDRLFIPQTKFPGISFIGQILGPRGSSLKAMQNRVGATIVIRGKGSVKEGRAQQRGKQQRQQGAGSRSGSRALDDSSQPLHVVISADAQCKVEEAKRLVQQVIDDAITTPEWQNDRKRHQLRDLAIANGTFRDDEGRQSTFSGRALCNEFQVARPCGGACPDDDSLDEEYKRFLEDIGEERQRESTDKQQQALPPLPPWRKLGSGAQGHLEERSESEQQQASDLPPWRRAE